MRLIELGYWPATPSRPGLAFSQAFMSWMEALLLECQVDVQDFSSAVEMFVKEKFTKVSNCHCTVSMHVNTYITFKGIDSFNLS